MHTLYESAHFHVASVDREKLLRVRRSATSFESVHVAADAFDALAAEIGKHDVAGYALLFDVREAHGRNDPEFENMISARRDMLFGRFRKRAILLRTMAGVLQTQRLDRETGGRFHVEAFTDEALALSYLAA